MVFGQGPFGHSSLFLGLSHHYNYQKVSSCFPCMLTNGFMSDAFMKTSIILILKNQKCDTSAN